jgi:hypothetical protein
MIKIPLKPPKLDNELRKIAEVRHHDPFADHIRIRAHIPVPPGS